MSTADLEAVERGVYSGEHSEPDDNDGNAWDGEHDVEAKDDSAPRIPAGEYDAIVIRGDVHTYQWTGGKSSRRLVLTLEIYNHQLAGTRLEFICTLPAKAPRGKTNRIGNKTKFMRAWEVANRGPAKRGERLKISVFRNRMFHVAVGDVERDRNQQKLARPYSIVKALLEHIA